MSTLQIKAAPTFLFFRQLTFDKVSGNDKITTGDCKQKREIEIEKRVSEIDNRKKTNITRRKK